MYQIIQKRKISFIVSGVLLALSILSLALWGLKPAIDFTGGALMEVEFLSGNKTAQEVKSRVEGLGIGDVIVQPIDGSNFLIRFKQITEDQHQEILDHLNSWLSDSIEVENTGVINLEIDEDGQAQVVDVATEQNNLDQKRFELIGPTIGDELKNKAIKAIIAVVILIVLYVAYVFRKVSEPVASWKFGLAAIVALVHDILIVTGVFAVLGQFMNVEVGSLFVIALLTVLGYSVNDSIVVFDRIRENLKRDQGGDFEKIVNVSVNQTIIRSLNTSITTILVLLTLFIFGGASIKYFVLALLIGAVVGTYSSIFIASPVLVVWEKWRNK